MGETILLSGYGLAQPHNPNDAIRIAGQIHELREEGTRVAIVSDSRTEQTVWERVLRNEAPVATLPLAIAALQQPGQSEVALGHMEQHLADGAIVVRHEKDGKGNLYALAARLAVQFLASFSDQVHLVLLTGMDGIHDLGGLQADSEPFEMPRRIHPQLTANQLKLESRRYRDFRNISPWNSAKTAFFQDLSETDRTVLARLADYRFYEDSAVYAAKRGVPACIVNQGTERAIPRVLTGEIGTRFVVDHARQARIARDQLVI